MRIGSVRASGTPARSTTLTPWWKRARAQLRAGALQLRLARRGRDLEYSALGLTASQQDAYEYAAIVCAQVGLEPWQMTAIARSFAQDGQVRL